jgi:hypothetical protein
MTLYLDGSRAQEQGDGDCAVERWTEIAASGSAARSGRLASIDFPGVAEDPQGFMANLKGRLVKKKLSDIN